MLRVALLGAGRVAQHYVYMSDEFIAPGLLSFTAVVDEKPEAANALAKRLGAQVLPTISAITPDVADLVVVLPPSGLHEAHSRQLLQQGMPVLSEKPLGLSIEAVLDNAKYAREKGLAYGGIFQNRFNPALLFAQQVVSSGRLGRIVSAGVRLRWCRYQPYYEDGWHGTWKLDGGVSNQQAIHHVDALQWLCGMPRQLAAFKGRQVNRLEAEDTMVASGLTEKDVFFTFEATTAARPEDFEASLSLVGEKGYLEVSGVALNEIRRCSLIGEEAREAEYCATHSKAVRSGYGVGHADLLLGIADRFAATGKIQLPLSAEESLNAVRFVHAMYRATEDGQNIQFDGDVRSRLLGV